MQDEEQNQPEKGWVFRPGASAQSPMTPQQDDYTPKTRQVQDDSVQWSASEYIANPKNSAWFMGLMGASILVAVVTYFVTSDFISAGVVILLGIIVGVFAARQPHVLNYRLDQHGISMGSRLYPYEGFKSFSVITEGPFNHISLLSLRRFMPPLSVHYAPDDEDMIVETLAEFLPYEEHKRDLVESFSRRVRF